MSSRANEAPGLLKRSASQSASAKHAAMAAHETGVLQADCGRSNFCKWACACRITASSIAGGTKTRCRCNWFSASTNRGDAWMSSASFRFCSVIESSLLWFKRGRRGKGSSIEIPSGSFVLAEYFKRVVQSRFHGSQRDVHGVGDLGQTETVHKTKQQYLTMLLRHRSQRRAQLLSFAMDRTGRDECVDGLQFSFAGSVAFRLATNAGREIADRWIKKGP